MEFLVILLVISVCALHYGFYLLNKRIDFFEKSLLDARNYLHLLGRRVRKMEALLESYLDDDDTSPLS